MIRKMPVFTDPRIDFSNRGFRPARKLGRDIVELAQDISMCTDQPYTSEFIADAFKKGKVVADLENCHDFFHCSKLAHRVETSIQQLSSDEGQFITKPLLVHIGFFGKEQRQPFFEIKLKMYDDWSGRCYYSGFIVHMRIPISFART